MSFRLLLTLFAAALAITAADDPWHYLDPGSKMVMGIQWRRIQDSPLGQKLRQDLHEQLSFPALPGTAFLNSVDHVLIGSTGVLKNGKSVAQPAILIVISGQFDLAKVRAAVNKKSRRAVVQNIEIFESPDKSGGNLGIALVSSETLLLGDFATIVKALGATPLRESEQLTRARHLAERNEFWITSSVSPNEVTGPNMQLPVPLPLDEVEGLEMGFSIASGMGMDLTLQMSSPDAAQELKSKLVKTIKLAGKEKRTPEMANLDKYLKVNADKEFVTMNFQMDAAAVDQRMRAWQVKRKAESAALATATIPQQPQPQQQVAPLPPPKPVITKPVIWNADPPPKP